MKINLTILFFIGSGFLLLFHCKSDKKTVVQTNFKESLTAIKFMNISTYPYSITESKFWEKGDYEFAKIKMDLNLKEFYTDVRELKKIDVGLAENFKYAFILLKEKSSDTIYASLSKNLWTIKKNGSFIYYKDENETLKKDLLLYSSFFDNCW